VEAAGERPAFIAIYHTLVATPLPSIAPHRNIAADGGKRLWGTEIDYADGLSS